MHMKSWALVLAILAVVGLVVLLRRRYRDDVTRWLAPRLGQTQASGRRSMLVWSAVAFGISLALVGAALWVGYVDGAAHYLRYPIALAVAAFYTPVATLGAPKMIKWQKSFGQHLLEAGTAREAAIGAVPVARFFSVVGLLLGIAAVLVTAMPRG